MALIQLALVGAALAAIAGMLLRVWANWYLPPSTPDPIRRRYRRACFSSAFTGLLWILLVFIGYSYINDWFFHRDDGLSTNPHAPLPNGYIVGSVDYHAGYVVSPGHPVSDHPRQEGADRLSDVLDLAVTKDFILAKQWMWDTPSHIGYTLWDLRDNSQLHFDSSAKLRTAVGQRGMWIGSIPDEGWTNPGFQPKGTDSMTRVDLVSYWDFYTKYRHTWFDWFAISLMICGQLGILALLVMQGSKIRASTQKGFPAIT